MHNLTDLSTLRNSCGAMLSYPQWVAWRKEPLPNGKTKKMLIDPKSGKWASSTGSHTWGTFEQVEQFIAGNTEEYGCGFVFTENDPYFFVDVDNKCPHTDQWSIYLRSMLPGAFAETSQSGNGLHIVGIGNKPDGYGCKSDADWDIYVTGRFVAMTGRDVTGHTDTYDHTASVTALTTDYLAPQVNKSIEWADTGAANYTCRLSDAELIDVACKSKSMRNRFGSSASFKQLWDMSDDLHTFYPNDQDPSQADLSAVDMAMATQLMFYFGGNCQRVEHVMLNLWKGSRDKLQQRGKYREDTILKARGLVTEFYQQQSAVVAEAVAAAKATPVVEYSATVPRWKSGIEFGVGEYGKEHTQNALEFLKTYYNHQSAGNSYLVTVEEDLYRFNGQVWEAYNDKLLDSDVSLAMMHESPQSGAVDGTVKMIKRYVTKAAGEWNTYGERDTRDLIVFQNGILDAGSNEFLPHDHKYLTTNIMPYSYNPAAVCPTWQNFLNDVFENDAERVALLQEWMGYLMVRDYRFHKAMLMIGLRRSGKGTIGQVIENLVGDQNFIGFDLDSLADDETINGMKNKTVAFDDDAAQYVNRNEEGKIVSRFKKLTAHGPISFKRKFKSSQSYRFPTRITIAANNMINLTDDSGATASRFMVLPFNKSWYGREDLTLGDKLAAEIEGIAIWCLAGLTRLRAAGKFTEPAISTEEIESLHTAYSPLSQFADDCLEFVEYGAWEPSQKLYGIYAQHTKLGGGKPMAIGQFSKKMLDTYRGRIHKTTQNNQRGFSGVKIKTATV